MFQFEMPEKLDVPSTRLEKRGKYHCLVNSVLDGEDPRGNPIEGFTVYFSVLGGSEDRKEAIQIFFSGGASEYFVSLNKSLQAKFLIATNLVNPAKKGERVLVDLKKAVTSQVIVDFGVYKSKKDGNEYMTVKDIWHVDDPRVADVPKDDVVDAIDPQLRHVNDDEFFSKVIEATGGGSSAKEEQRKPAMKESDLASL